MTRRNRRLIIALLAILCVGGAAALGLAGLSRSISYFYGPTALHDHPPSDGARIRLGGLVKAGSIKRSPETGQVDFIVTDNHTDIAVRYAGITPDLFRERQGVVAEGRMGQDRVFVADTLLARHDETYMPKEVYQALKSAGAEPVPAVPGVVSGGTP